MKIVFMGTPDFTVPILESLYNVGHTILCVVTQPDAPVGRKQILTAPPAKEWALEKGIDVYQPERIRDQEAVEHLKKYDADIFVVAAFGQILPAEVLFMPKYGSVNIHASLLPKYRGASPIQWAILNGDETTGITIMQMGEGLDDGDILLQESVKIDSDDTGESLFDKLSVLGGKAIVKALPLIESGEIKPVKQNESLATKVGKIDKSLGRIDWSKSAVEICRYIRGLYSWPCTYTTYKGKTLKILDADVVGEAEFATMAGTSYEALNSGAGVTVEAGKTMWMVNAKEGLLSLRRVQEEGRKAMSVEDYLKGHNVEVGDRFE